MKTHYNDVEYSKKMAQKGLSSFPPAIAFERSTEKKVNKEEEEKDLFKTFDVRIDKKDKDSDTLEYSVKVFEEGNQEAYVKWLEAYKELEDMMPLEQPEHKVNVIRNILKGSYLETFNNNLGDGEGSEKKFTEKKVTDALKKVTLKAFNNDRHAYRRQVQYMRYQLYFTTTNFKTFEHRLKQLNKYLKYFPIPPGKRDIKSLPDDQLIEIIDNSKPLEYHQQMLQNNYDPYDKSLEEFVQYIERLEASAKIGSAISKRMTNTSSTGRKGQKRTNKQKSNEEENKLHKCKYCKKMVTHEPDKCWEKPGNEQLKPNWMKKRRTTTGQKTPSFTSEQVNFLIQNAHLAKHGKNKNKKVRKRKVTYKEQSNSDLSNPENSNVIDLLNGEGENNLTDNSDVEDYYNLHIENHRTTKRRKISQATSELVGEVLNNDNQPHPIRVLLDSGTTATIILKPFVNNISKYKHERTKWQTMGGNFHTRRKALISFKLIEFSNNKMINWTAHVDETTDPSKAKYDLIIGSDLMSKLKIDLLYSQQQIVWDEVSIPMKNRGTISDHNITHDIYELSKESTVIQMSKERHNKIVQAMYGKVDIRKHVQTLQHLTL